MPKLLSLLLSAMVISAPVLSDVLVTGVATDCFETSSVQVGDVNVAAFDPATNQTMVDLLRAMDTVTLARGDTAAFTSFESQYVQMISLVNSSVALARDTTTSTGDFALSVTPRDSVLIVGYMEAEDEPFYHAYKMIGALTNTHFVLDMSGGGCNYLNP